MSRARKLMMAGSIVGFLALAACSEATAPYDYDEAAFTQEWQQSAPHNQPAAEKPRHTRKPDRSWEH
ncbi:MAG: hypothetical protein GTN78_02145 [Gemmatimonadales bacterium]|nr:hypothetical protein [Gemmatimonadales bacterium]NIN10762.1 hypothetical protein [Gemmatimonadales bacterium]NIQ98992.1 hypothetical protein [Gemmatimonadales bacterium]NIS63811.1 hypothetical protein [Gemmatimonadales bacterium]